MLKTEVEEKREYKTLDEFWPFYLSEHRKPLNRTLHFIGSSAGLGWLAGAIYKKKPSLILAGLITGYAFAWIGHFLVEKNKPASFKYPFKSFLSDWRMFYAILTGKIDQEMEKVREFDSENSGY